MAAGQITALWSPKGGVGKTLLSAAIALRLAERTPTVLIDGNADNPDLTSLLQSPSLPNIGTWPGKVAPEEVERHLVRWTSRLFLLPGPSRFIDEAVLSGEAMETALRSLSAAGMAVVVDLSTGLRDSTLTALDQADRILMPVTLDLLSLTPLKRVARELDFLKLPAHRFRVVINRLVESREITPDDVKALSPFTVVGTVPSTKQAAQAVNRGDVEAALASGSPIGKAVAALLDGLSADRASAQSSLATTGPRLWNRLWLSPGKEGA